MFFGKQKTAYEMRISDWSSDVCSSDLLSGPAEQTVASTSLGFEIRPSTTVFRFRRLPADGPAAALALRNGLTRDTVEPARSHVRLKQAQALAMLGLDRKSTRMTSSH